MTKFVGAEYVIACTLIELKKKGIERVKVEDFYKYGIQMQKYSNNENIDAVFLVAYPYLEKAIFNFSDYFQVNENEDGKVESISIVKEKEVTDLNHRFVGNIPLNILSVMDRVLQQIAA